MWKVVVGILAIAAVLFVLSTGAYFWFSAQKANEVASATGSVGGLEATFPSIPQQAKGLRPRLTFVSDGSTPQGYPLYTYLVGVTKTPASIARLKSAVAAMLDRLTLAKLDAEFDPVRDPKRDQTHLVVILSLPILGEGPRPTWDVDAIVDAYDRDAGAAVLRNAGLFEDEDGPLLVASALPLTDMTHDGAAVLAVDIACVPESEVANWIRFYLRELEAGRDPRSFSLTRFRLEMRGLVETGGLAIIPTANAVERVLRIIQGSSSGSEGSPGNGLPRP